MKYKMLGFALAALLIAWAPLIASTPAVPWFSPPKQGEDPSYDSSTREKLATLKVSVQWNSVPLKAALEELTSKSQQADPAHEGIKFTSKLPSDDLKVSLTLANTTLDDLLGYLSAQARFRVKIHKGEVLVLPLKAP